MANELIINASLPETRIALMEDGQIQELLIERASGKGIVGNIYKGRVTRVLPGMQAAFVDIGLEKAAFLYVDDVYVHSEIWEDEEEGSNPAVRVLQEVQSVESSESTDSIDSTQKVTQEITAAPDASEIENAQVENRTENVQALSQDSSESAASDSDDSHSKFSDQEQAFERQGVLDEDEDSDDSDSSGAPVSMSADPNDSGSDGNNGDQASSEQPSGTLAPDQSVSEKEGKGDQPEPKIVARREAVAEAGTSPEEGVSSEALASSEEEGEKDSRGKRHRRGGVSFAVRAQLQLKPAQSLSSSKRLILSPTMSRLLILERWTPIALKYQMNKEKFLLLLKLMRKWQEVVLRLFLVIKLQTEEFLPFNQEKGLSFVLNAPEIAEFVKRP